MPELTRKLAIKIAQYHAERLPEEQAWFLKQMKELEIACTVDGVWVRWELPLDSDWRQVAMSRKAVKKFLRQAYLHGGPATLRGQALDTIIEAFVGGVERATRRVFEANVPGAIKEIRYHDR